jgi:predicted DNA-binding transcriptional regulator YafY
MSPSRKKKGVRSSQKAVADRHLEIKLAAEQGQGDLVRWICDKFGFGPRTARRDLLAIKRTDLPWWKKNIHEMRGLINGRSGPDGHTPERPELQEAIAGVVVLEKLTGGLLSIAQRDATRAARQTERLLGAKDEQNVRALRRFIQLRHQPTRITPAQTEAFARIVEAHLKGQAIEIVYSNIDEALPGTAATPSTGSGKARKAQPRRRVGPVCLFHAKRSWYLLAHVLEGKSKGELRQFKLARIERTEVVDQPFMPPSGFDLESHLQGAWELFRRPDGVDRRIRVVIDFDAPFSKNILETMWHSTQSIEPRSGGGVRFTAEVNGFDEILWWVLQMGSHAVVVEPADLRSMVAKELDATRKLYA